MIKIRSYTHHFFIVIINDVIFVIAFNLIEKKNHDFKIMCDEIAKQRIDFATNFFVRTRNSIYKIVFVQKMKKR